MSIVRKAGRVVRAIAVAIAGLIGEAVDTVWELIIQGLKWAEQWLVGAKHAQYGLAVTRILLGVTGLGLLATNFATRHYTFGSGSAWNGESANPRSDFPNIWIFSYFNRIANHESLFTISYIALAVLALAVTLGWRTRIIMPIFFIGWVSFIEMNDLVGDQGDNMYRITVLLLLFADSGQKWSMDARRRTQVERQTGPWVLKAWRGARIMPVWFTNALHNLVLVALTAQVSFVYVSGALYKAGGLPWQSGYAIYNPLQTERFGVWPWLSDVMTAWAPVTTVISWSSIILQLTFPLMLMRRPTRIIALFGILSFHIGIAVLMGLPWFSLAMIAVDSIFIRDVTWQRVGARVDAAYRGALDSLGDDGSAPSQTPDRSRSRPIDRPDAHQKPVGSQARNST